MSLFVLDLRSAPRGGAVVPAVLTSPAHGLDLLQACSDIVFMVHGFNVDRADGSVELQALGARLSAAHEIAAVAVLWPGDSLIGPLCYPFETNKADDSAVELARFVNDNLPQRPRISFVGHSLGCRVVMETVRQLWVADVPVSQVCLMAAAIDTDSLAVVTEYAEATRHAERVAVLYSAGDHVLEFAYPLGNLLSAFAHAAGTTDVALGYAGPRSAQDPPADVPATVSAVAIGRDSGVDHGDYLPDAGGHLSAKQVAASKFADAAVQGSAPLAYAI